MAVFSDLPNELIIIIWGYVIEPESVESFALVSKRVHGLAAPFVREHAILNLRYSQIWHSMARWRAADLLETILLNPRISLYMNEFRIVDWATRREEQYNSPLEPYPGGTMRNFEDAVRSSPFIPHSEVEQWIKAIKEGDESPVLALILMQFGKLKVFEILKSSHRSDQFILETLDRMAQSPAAIHPRPSMVGSEFNTSNQVDFSQPSSCSEMGCLKLFLSDIDLEQLSRLLRGTRGLNSFSFIGNANCSIEPSQICNELLASSQHSLVELRLETLYGLSKASTSYMGDITRFEKLAVLETHFDLLFCHKDETCHGLADVLPMSIERITLSSIAAMCSKVLKEVVLQMVKSKTNRLPNLTALEFKWLEENQWCHPELLIELKEKSAEVGVLLSTIPSA